MPTEIGNHSSSHHHHNKKKSTWSHKMQDLFFLLREMSGFFLTIHWHLSTQKMAVMSLMLIRMSLWFKGQLLNKNWGEVQTNCWNDCTCSVEGWQLFGPAIHAWWFHWLVSPGWKCWLVGKWNNSMYVKIMSPVLSLLSLLIKLFNNIE